MLIKLHILSEYQVSKLFIIPSKFHFWLKKSFKLDFLRMAKTDLTGFRVAPSICLVEIDIYSHNNTIPSQMLFSYHPYLNVEALLHITNCSKALSLQNCIYTLTFIKQELGPSAFVGPLTLIMLDYVGC